MATSRPRLAESQFSPMAPRRPIERHTARHFYWTINNYIQSDWDAIERVSCGYICYQQEVGEKDGTPHIQGYCFFPVATTVGGCCKRLGNRAHVLMCDGSPESNREYCSKIDGTEVPDTFVERGIIPKGRGHRRDIEAFCRSMIGGATRQELWADHPTYMICHYKGVEAYHADHPVERTKTPTVRVFFGATGTGKTEYITDLNRGHAYPLSRGMTGAWWNGYDPRLHDVILIDEFHGDMKWGDFLLLLDKQPMYVQSKGGLIAVGDCDIYIATNKPINEWYRYNRWMPYAALVRRVTEYWVCESTVWNKENCPPELVASTFVEPQQKNIFSS